MVLSFSVDSSLSVGISRLSSVLGFREGEGGVAVTAEQGERVGVIREGATARILYRHTSEFFRGLGILCEHAEEPHLEILEDTAFTELSVMLTTAAYGTPSVSSVCRFLDRMALMGYSALLLYIEDNVKVEGYPYLGYMRGRYTEEDLRAIDDYAFAYGIEVIGCLECYGHMEKYLIWDDSIRDTASVLLAREERTFTFLDKLIGTFARCLRSRRLHIGMDEAWDMGRGKFLDIHGYVPPAEIFAEYMERLSAIVASHGLHPMMWSDMYFRANDAGHKNRYYGSDVRDLDAVSRQIPEDMTLVFWHYGEAFGCDDEMLRMHKALDRPIIFAGGAWNWSGHFPENDYAEIATKASLAACRHHGVTSAMMTLWGSECPMGACLYALSYMAELCYRGEPDDATLASRFRATTGGDRAFFHDMSGYHNEFGTAEDYPVYSRRFLGRALFWQDVMEGLFDTHLFEKAKSPHYAALAERMREAPQDEWQSLYGFAADVLTFLSVKCRIAERLYPSYTQGDCDTLATIANEELPVLLDLAKAVRASHRGIWAVERKPLGWSTYDRRYGALIARIEGAMLRLSDYLAGRVDTLEELDEGRLYKGVHGFLRPTQMYIG